MSNRKDLTGQRFGRLTVLKHVYTLNKRVYWLCKCDCGNEKIINGNSLKRGLTKSCGCLNRELLSLRSKHGMFGTRIYGIWSSIKQRCFNKNAEKYKIYGGRGITMCEEWKDFKVFYEWSKNNGYEDDLTIDRIDSNGNYCPENCKWSTQREQQNNRRNNHLITYNGKTQTIAQWSRELNFKPYLLYLRFKNNWSIERAFTTPVRECKR